MVNVTNVGNTSNSDNIKPKSNDTKLNYSLLNQTPIDTFENTSHIKGDSKNKNYMHSIIAHISDNIGSFFGKLVNSSSSTACDGNITDFNQGLAGDCWLLSTTKSIANNPDGEKLVVNSVVETNDGWNVTFKGAPDKVYNVTKQELYDAKMYTLPEKSNDESNNLNTTTTNTTFNGTNTTKNLNLTNTTSNLNMLKLLNHNVTQSPENLNLTNTTVDLNQTNTTNSLNPTNITDDSISENNDFNLTSYINDNFDNRNTMSVGDDDVTIIEIAAKKHYTDIYGGSELDAQKLISGHHPDYASVPYGKGTINEYYNNNFGKLSAEEQANAAKIIDEVTNNYDNASETSLNWYKSNDDIVSSYEVKQKALTILNEAKNQQSQISMTATKDHHIYIVTLDPDNGDILVNDPFNTAGKPDRYKTNDAFLNDYRDISFLNENKLK